MNEGNVGFGGELSAKVIRNPVYRYACVVNRVVDGDTLDVDVDLGFHVWVRKVKIRLTGINCPEMNTEAGKAAKAFVFEVLAPIGISTVVIDTIKADKYGNRWNAVVYLPGGSSLNDLLVQAGHALRA